ncbi:pyridoxal phosphate-dependent aminotransferase [Zavarzinia sp.]|uniref:pyridoxal phosphate-dependent aminotransferase n=1 Tax=Zavarzinia sp. TaxID=2027920 RepID=UPI0035649762
MGPSVKKPFEERNLHFDRLIGNKNLKWLGQNTNHIPCHPAVREAMLRCIADEEFHIYAPPCGIEELRALILDDLGLPADEFSVLVTDGAIEALYHAVKTWVGSGDRFIATDPGWLWPHSFARAAGATVVSLPIYDAAAGYRLRPEALAAAAGPETRAIYLVDPNNPLGSCQTAEEIEAIAGIARKSGALLIHDCTYRHFAKAHTLAARFYPEGTVTTYSFSKWLGIAGLRCGAVVARRDMIEELAAAPPNNLGSSILAQRAAIAGLRHKAEWLPQVLSIADANQRRIAAAVQGVEGLFLPVYPSNGNFIAIDVTGAGISPDALAAAYLRHDIMIRQASYHSREFADRFIKVGTTVPEAWVEDFCTLLPGLVAEVAAAAGTARVY